MPKTMETAANGEYGPVAKALVDWAAAYFLYSWEGYKKGWHYITCAAVYLELLDAQRNSQPAPSQDTAGYRRSPILDQVFALRRLKAATLFSGIGIIHPIWTKFCVCHPFIHRKPYRMFSPTADKATDQTAQSEQSVVLWEAARHDNDRNSSSTRSYNGSDIGNDSDNDNGSDNGNNTMDSDRNNDSCNENDNAGSNYRAMPSTKSPVQGSHHNRQDYFYLKAQHYEKAKRNGKFRYVANANYVVNNGTTTQESYWPALAMLVILVFGAWLFR
ncbi:hypothetical protein F5Y17DRAFT_451755 [Xylariaceae sp. FL0594]|nr:hypothetical protein F5Y17DRAFT_451755 [Xylariaceae sp. FL0594]